MSEKKPTYRVEIKNSRAPPNDTFEWHIYRNQDVLPLLRSQQHFVSRMAGLADANRSRLQLIDADTLGWPPQSTGQMQGDERALRRLLREQPASPHVFVSERGTSMAPKSSHALISRLGERAGVPFPSHPHMLRYACGFAVTNAGQFWRPERLRKEEQRRS
jgi:hypothetical protein